MTLRAHPDLMLSCPRKCYGQLDVSASFGLMVFGVTKPFCDSASKVSTHWPEAYLCHPLLGPSQSSSTVPKISSQNSLETQRTQMFIMLPSKRVKLFQLVVQSLHLPTSHTDDGCPWRGVSGHRPSARGRPWSNPSKWK